MNIWQFKKIFKIKFYFKIPEKKTFVIFDKTGSENIIKNLPKNSYYILHTRGEKLNLYILIKIILKFKLSNKSYIKEYIQNSYPKAIITWIDNNIFFYQLELKGIKKISIQNGRRSNLPSDIFYNLKEKRIKNLRCNYIFTHNIPIKNLYNKYIDSKFLVSGSFKSNNIAVNQKFKKIELLYISTFRNTQNYELYKNYDWYLWQKKEILLLKFAEKYCQKRNIELTILGSEMNYSSELKFYKNHLISEFHFIKKNKYRNVYKLIDVSKVIFGIDSTLLSEALGRNAKVAFFSCRGNKFPFNSRKFGWPLNYPSKGKFWNNDLKYENFETILNFLFGTKKFQWKNFCKPYKKNIMEFDKNNKLFKDLIIKIQKN